MKTHFIGLDIGSASLKMIAAKPQGEGEGLEIVAFGEEQSSGVRKGAVVNPEELTKRISVLKTRLEQTISRRIDEAVVSIGGSHIFITPSRGVVAVSRADGQISQEDVERVLQAAQALSLPSNKEILEVVPQEFTVDGNGGIKEPVGMRGIRLETEVAAICAFSPYVKHLSDAVLAAGLEVGDIIPAPLASAHALLSSNQKESGVALLDIGAATTGIAIFEEGDLIHLAVLPIGSDNITQDIAIGLRTVPEIAEILKKEYGSCLASKGKRIEKVQLEGGEEIKFPRTLLTHIIASRMQEIFQLANKELKKVARQGKLPAGVILAGGGVKLPGVIELGKKEFRVSVKRGTPQGIWNAQADPAFFGAMGLVRRAYEIAESGGGFRGSRPGNAWKSVKKAIKIFLP
ncbi:MAG: cell division protein FtsA [bacterium]|nr:cell division protein FtsA [bacterium]